MTAEQVLNDEIKQVKQETWGPYPGAQSLALAQLGETGPREILFGGSRGPGKSFIQRLALAKLAVAQEKPGVLKYPNYKGAIFRYHSVDLRDWHSEAEKFYCAKLGAVPKGQPREYHFPGGPVIRSGHLQDGGYINYVGWEIHKGGIDELTHLPTKHDIETGIPACPDYQLLLASLRLSPDGNPQMFNTANPGEKGHMWVRQRFINVYVNGEKLKPRTPFRDPVSGHLRIFIDATVMDNPWILQNDPGYLQSLFELPPAKQKAWIYGDWDAFEGQFFNFSREHHVIEPHEAAGVVPPWCYRWASCDWGYSHTCAIHGAAQGLDGRIHVYKELIFDGKVGSFEVGVEIGRAFALDLEALPDKNMSLYIGHDAFNEVDVNNRRVDGIRAGIQAVLGPSSCFILEMSADEKREAQKDPDNAVVMMNRRRAAMAGEYGITIVKAPKNSYDSFNYMHELLRTEVVDTSGEPDLAVVENLRKHPNAERLVANYLAGFNQAPEVVPKIKFWSCCKRVIETMPEMIHDEKDPEKMAKVNGDDSVDSVLYLCAGHRAAQNQMPLSYYVQDQLAQAFHGRTVDPTMAHIMALHAQEKYGAEYAPQEPLRLGRYGMHVGMGAN